MIRCMLESSDGSIRTGGSELLIEWQRNREGKFWLDIQEEDTSGERKLLEKLGLHTLAVQDAQRDRHLLNSKSSMILLLFCIAALPALTRSWCMTHRTSHFLSVRISLLPVTLNRQSVLRSYFLNKAQSY